MILIADSGSTKTEWALTDLTSPPTILHTQGINPFMLTTEEIIRLLHSELMPQIFSPEIIATIHFYGAGCRPEQCESVKTALVHHFPQSQIEIQSDMLGAARSVCGHLPGITCILGTGSNSCLYNGTSIVESVSPLGFILGDEGSGAVLGKRLVSDILKRQISPSLCKSFMKEYNETESSIIHNVYKKAFPNRYLAHFVPFLNKHQKKEEIQRLILDEFSRFLHRNILQYNRRELPLHFVGSIAYHFAGLLETAVRQNGFQPGKILKSPIPGLVEYHASIK
ncbi:MAG TPA: ATPase [Alloprevotella sp.]|nr:ATPase [Alloprevotella sp.]